MSDEDAIGESFFDVSGLPEEDGVDEDDSLVGTILDGRYRLERLLGEGGMGRVYAGIQLSVEREVAVKLLRAEALVQREVKERFFREAQVISGFGHPNIVRLIDYGEDDALGLPYLVMELVRGVSLGELTRRGRLRLPLALEIVDQVCSGLIQAHSSGIVHRDLKPDNLQLLPVVGGSFQTKVLDFGVAFPSDTNSRLTSTGMICGTAYYIAPEQARAHELDGRADLYALGIILFEMLTGQLPFGGDSDFQILLMQVQQPPPSLSEFIPDDTIPQAVADLVNDLLAKDPDDRPASAREVRERIEAIRADNDIAPLQIDLEDDSADAFEPWLLERADDDAVVEASGPVDASMARQQLGRLEDDAQRDDQDDTDRQGPAQSPRTHQTSAETSPGSGKATGGSRSGLLFAVAAVVVLAGAAAAAYFLTPLLSPTDEPAVANSPADPPSDDDPEPAAVAVEDQPLSAFAGRCAVIGESDAWFYTVFLYPEVGELLLEGDDKLAWSPVEVAEHKGNSVTFDYRPAETDQELSVRVEKRADRLVFELPGGVRFLCRRHDVQRYYDTVGVSGSFVADDETAAVIPPSGQRFEVGDVAYVYRILSGSEAASRLHLAVREADDREATWKRWTIAYDREAKELRLGPHGDPTTYIDATYRAKQAAKERAARQKAKSRPPTAAAAPSPRRPSESNAGASDQEIERYRTKLEKLGDRCASYMNKMKANIAHVEKLQEEKRYEELKEFSETMQAENKHYSEMMQKVSKEYSQLMTEITLSNMNRAQIVGLSQIFTNKCSWE